MILVIDHYDSFIDMICDYLVQLGQQYILVKTDKLTSDILIKLKPSHLVVGPGPGHPRDDSLLATRALLGDAIIHRIPVLGICLGHQLIAEHYGIRVVQARLVAHGVVSEITHSQDRIFAGISSPIKVTRYHSLLVENKISADNELEITAVTQQGEIMSLCHRNLPVFGVQFHPESVMTQYGRQLLTNFINTVRPPAN